MTGTVQPTDSVSYHLERWLLALVLDAEITDKVFDSFGIRTVKSRFISRTH